MLGYGENFLIPLKSLRVTKTRRSGFFRVLAMLSLFVAGPGLAESSVWKVSKGDATVYLGGTIHMLRESDYPLPDEYEQAYQLSDQLYFETDITGMNDLSVQTQMLQKLMYTDGTTLETVLSAEAFEALEAYGSSVGMPVMMLQTMKPGLVVSMLQVLEFQKLGFTPEGIDMYFNARASEDSKPVGQLETIEEQIGFLESMGQGHESEFILQSLRDMNITEAMIDDMIQALKAGDSVALMEQFVSEMRSESPEVYKALLVDRNNDWIPQVENMLADSDREFVLVGAAHLVGPDGLVEKLQQLGYRVEKL